MELMSTMVARADCRSRGSTAWVTRSVPRTLVAYIRSHSRGSPSSTRVTPNAPPALLTTTSQRRSDATPSVTDSGSVTSMTRARADPPLCSMLDTTSSSFSRRRPATTTSKPSRESRLAMAAPMPVPPPVMRAVGRDWSLLWWSLVTPPRIGVAAGQRVSRRAAASRSPAVVTLSARTSPWTTRTRSPRRSTRPASSVAARETACARSSTSRRKPWGVWTARSAERSGVPTTRPPSSTCLIVSTTAVPGTTATAPPTTAATTRSKTSTGVRHRAASCTRTMSTSSGRARRPAATESPRSTPPTTTVTRLVEPTSRHTPSASERACSRCEGGTTSTTSATAAHDRTPRRACPSRGTPARGTNALGTPAPRREPAPAATTMTPTRPAPVSLFRTLLESGSEDLVEDGLCLLLVGLLRERQLGDEDLTGLGEHALLAGRQATVLVPTPQVTNDLGDLDDVARRELLEVRLVATRPVGRLLRVRGAQDLEHPVQALLAHDVADTHEVAVLGGDLDRQVTLSDLELQVELVLSLDRSCVDLFDECSPVVGVHDRLADLENHLLFSPFATSRLSRSCAHRDLRIWHHRRSEPQWEAGAPRLTS